MHCMKLSSPCFLCTCNFLAIRLCSMILNFKNNKTQEIFKAYISINSNFNRIASWVSARLFHLPAQKHQYLADLCLKMHYWRIKYSDYHFSYYLEVTLLTQSKNKYTHFCLETTFRLTSLLTLPYFSKFSGTMVRWGHSLLAINPGMAARTPNLLAW